MKTININQLNLEACVDEAQRGGVLVMRNGMPAALVLGVEGMDREQVELGLSEPFWTLITQRRRERTISRAELEKRIRDNAEG